MWNLNKHQTQKKESGLWLYGLGGGGRLEEGGQKIQTSSYKINKHQGWNLQHDDSS